MFFDNQGEQAQVDIFNIVVYIDSFTGGNEWSVR